MPVTETWKVPAAANVQDSVTLPVAATLVGATVHDVLFVERFTVNGPWSSVMVMLEVPALPALTVTLVGLAAIVKS